MKIASVIISIATIAILVFMVVVSFVVDIWVWCGEDWNAALGVYTLMATLLILSVNTLRNYEDE